MTIKFPRAPRVQSLPPYPFVALGKKIQVLDADGGPPVIRLDMGSPDLPPPSAVIEALADYAARPDVHGYAGYRGTPNFRNAVARYYERSFGVTLDPDTEVLPLIGSKEGIVNLAFATLGRGDAVLVPSLAYPAYEMGAKLAEAETVTMPINVENDYKPVFDNVAEADRQRAKLLWLNYPNNPTGVFASKEYYGEAVEFCREHNILLCSDNPYVEMVFDGNTRAASVMQVDGAKDTAVEFISMSKSFNMAGWRIGAMVGHRDIIDTLLLVKSNVDSGHFKAIYEAAAVAMDTTPQSWIDARNRHYQHRRDLILEALPSIGLELESVPRGAMYVWAKVPNGNDIEYAERSLQEGRVSFAPGSIYGQDGSGYIRFSLGTPTSEIEEAMDRLRALWS